jgi:hypothetical protein
MLKPKRKMQSVIMGGRAPKRELGDVQSETQETKK